MSDKTTKRLERLVVLVLERDRLTQEILAILDGSKGVSRETIVQKRPKTEVPAKIEAQLEDKKAVLERFDGNTDRKGKCDGTATCPRRGRHKNTCPKATGVETEEAEATGPEKPPRELTGFQADWRSKCCNSRLIVRGGEEGTNHYECFKCCNPCDPVNPEPEETKHFECEKCAHKFEADVSKDINCPECGSKEIWPCSV